MTIQSIKAEFGLKEIVKYGTLAVVILFGGFKLDSLVKTNADGVVALHAIVERHDARIGALEDAKLIEEGYEAGYKKALEDGAGS